MIAVLQGWSKSTGTQRMSGLLFIALFGIAAVWGMRVLGFLHHGPR